MAIKCAASDCLHNKDRKCTSSVIQVDNCRPNGKRGNYCSTHTNDQGNYLLTATERPSYPAQANGVFNSEIAEELTVSRRSHNPAILCSVSECTFNNNKSCSAANVSIGRSFRKNVPRFPCKTCRAD